MGNSARSRTKNSPRGKGDGQQSQHKQKGRRRNNRQDREDNSAFTADEVIDKAELEKGENLLILNELKIKPVSDLVALAESMGIENMAR